MKQGRDQRIKESVEKCLERVRDELLNKFTDNHRTVSVVWPQVKDTASDIECRRVVTNTLDRLGYIVEWVPAVGSGREYEPECIKVTLL